jgi:adenylyltransferase/sulfurtransferase
MATATEPIQLPELTTDDLSRYSRHLILPEVGIEGQRKLKAARVLCVGTGGLGSPLAFYLAAAGIGTLGLVDFDVVDASNLQRQIIHSTKDIGRKKLDSAAEKLTALNPALNVVKHETMLTSANALDILKDYDIVADGTDNFPTRYLVNDACVILGIPNAYSPAKKVRAIAACIRSRHRQGSSRAAPKVECWEFCPVLSVSSRRLRSSSSSLARAIP